MKPPIEWTEHTAGEYRRAVERNLFTRYGVTIASLHAGAAVEAARGAGLSPAECFHWLVRIHRLAGPRRPGPDRSGPSL